MTISGSRKFRRRALGISVFVTAVGVAGCLVWLILRPDIWDRAKDGSLIGKRVSSFWMDAGSKNKYPRLDGWTATFSKSVWMDCWHVAAVRVGDRGIIVECALFFVNDDNPSRVIVEELARFGPTTPSKN